MKTVTPQKQRLCENLHNAEFKHLTRLLCCKFLQVKYTSGAFCWGLNTLRVQLTTNLAQKGRQLALKVLFYQSVIAIILAIFFTFYLDKYSGLSALYGGFTCVLPAMVFAFLAFRYAGASQNKLVVRSFNKGNKLKFIFTLVLFVMAYKWPNIQPLPLLISYVVTLMAQWPVIIFINRVNR